jgi:hypothetical protein
LDTFALQVYQPRTLWVFWCWTVSSQILWWNYLSAIIKAAFLQLHLILEVICKPTTGTKGTISTADHGMHIKVEIPETICMVLQNISRAAIA